MTSRLDDELIRVHATRLIVIPEWVLRGVSPRALQLYGMLYLYYEMLYLYPETQAEILTGLMKCSAQELSEARSELVRFDALIEEARPA
jgi:hypothetical protein